MSLPPCGGHPTCQAAVVGPAHRSDRQELGIGESNLSYWLEKDRESRTTADPSRFEFESAEARENAALPRGLSELGVEREILKLATAF